jgi:uncharacterized RDD family membrane protein YckC
VASTPPPPPPATVPPPPATTPPPPPHQSAAPAPSGPTSAETDDDLASLLSQISDEPETAAPSVGAPLTKPTDVERPTPTPTVTIESEGGIDFDPVLASYGARFGGLVIDTVIVVLCLLPGMVLVVAGSTALAIVGLIVMLAGFGVATTLYARAVSRTGQWVGNRVTNTKVVDVRNGRTVASGEAGLRFVIRYFVSSILLIGYLIAPFNSQRQTFHDMVAGTVVTRPPRATWSIDDEVTDG